MSNSVITFLMASAAVCFVSLVLEFVNRNSFKIHSSFGSQSDARDSDSEVENEADLAEDVARHARQAQNEQRILIGDESEFIPEESDEDVANDWRTAATFKDGALASLPLRAKALLKDRILKGYPTELYDMAYGRV